MKLEQQLISLQAAKRLKELGVNAEAVFFHAAVGDVVAGTYLTSQYKWWPFPDGVSIYPAYGVAEMMAALPQDANVYKSGDGLFYAVGACNERACWYEGLAHACGDLLIHLLETGQIAAEEVNERMK